VSGHPTRAFVAQIGLFRTTPGVGEVDAHDSAFSFCDFLAAVVTHENGLSSHDFLPA
jgi:hypothetical protein